MTDFIHEHHKDETPASPPPAPAEELPLDERTGQKRVYGYIFILFAVALALLIWAFFMNQRSADEMLSELRGNTGALQTTLDRNIALEQQVDALEAQLRDLEDKTEEQQTVIRGLEEKTAALEEERDALRGALAEAQEALKAFESQTEAPGG